MIWYFLAGVIVGVHLGLLLAPILRSWIYWQQERRWKDRDQSRDRARVS
jgi:hypothetical protein